MFFFVNLPRNHPTRDMRHVMACETNRFVSGRLEMSSKRKGKIMTTIMMITNRSNMILAYLSTTDKVEQQAPKRRRR